MIQVNTDLFHAKFMDYLVLIYDIFGPAYIKRHPIKGLGWPNML